MHTLDSGCAWFEQTNTMHIHTLYNSLVYMWHMCFMTLTFFISELLSQPGELGPELRGQDVALLLLVCHPHGLQNLCSGVLLLDLLVHHS